MGCIATTRRFFSDGKLSKSAGRRRARRSPPSSSSSPRLPYLGWQEVVRLLGTIKAVGDVAQAMKLTRGAVTEAAIDTIRERLLDFDQIADIKLPGLPADRRPVIAGGLLILDAAFAELEIKRMQVSDYALREGALYDILGRGGEHDPRDASIRALVERYAADTEQAARVERTALALFDQVAEAWQLDADDRRLLAWAARIHEIGLAIAHSQYHQHGAYLVEAFRHRRLLAQRAAVPRRGWCATSAAADLRQHRRPSDREADAALHFAPNAAAPVGAAAPQHFALGHRLRPPDGQRRKLELG
jgi:exopolyphosphatase/guanosine-5'-triphosphate,3'-diphosphate pyrophosphatase